VWVKQYCPNCFKPHGIRNPPRDGYASFLKRREYNKKKKVKVEE
jgi:hypothetical protein